MRIFLGQKWQNHDFGDKTVLQNLFSTRLLFTCGRWMHQTKDSIKKFEFLGKRDFYASLKIWSF